VCAEKALVPVQADEKLVGRSVGQNEPSAKENKGSDQHAAMVHRTLVFTGRLSAVRLGSLALPGRESTLTQPEQTTTARTLRPWPSSPE
jgi:hypothetical protein